MRAKHDHYDNRASRRHTTFAAVNAEMNLRVKGFNQLQNAPSLDVCVKAIWPAGITHLHHAWEWQIAGFTASTREGIESRRGLCKRFDEGSAQEHADQVTFVICAAFEVVDGVGSLGKRLTCIR